jgi:hypothetical protein
MHNNNKYETTDILDNISRVDAPPFLYTRIRQKIENYKEKVSPTAIWATTATLCLIVIFNLFVISKNNNSNTETANALVNSMNLNPGNTLYE